MNNTRAAFLAFDKALAASLGRSVAAFPAFDKALAASLGHSAAAVERMVSLQASRAGAMRDTTEHPDDYLIPSEGDPNA